VPVTPRLKRIILACLVAAIVCAVGILMGLANIHSGSEFSRTMLVVMFPTVTLASKYRLSGNVGLLLLVLLSAYLLWVLVVYLVLALLQTYDDA
jgi:hypothetical protein